MHLNLDRDDKMVVETFNDGTMTMNFEGTDGTLLEMIAKNHFITLKFTDKDGNPFEFSSDGYEFTIPGLKLDMTGYKLVASDSILQGDGHSEDHRRRMAASDSSHSEEAVTDDSHADDSHSDDHSSDNGHDEHHADTKIDSPPGTYTMADFAKYTKNNKK